MFIDVRIWTCYNKGVNKQVSHMTYTDIEKIYNELRTKFLAEEKKHEMDQNIMGTHMSELDEVLEILHDIVDYSPTDEEINYNTNWYS